MTEWKMEVGEGGGGHLPSFTGNPSGNLDCINSRSLLNCLKGAMTSQTSNKLERETASEISGHQGKVKKQRKKMDTHAFTDIGNSSL